MSYHVREWLNPEGLYATSTITAFHGITSYHNDKNEVVEFDDKKLSIHDCVNSIRIHQTPRMTDQMFIDKVKLIAKVCTDFAEYLENNLTSNKV